MNNDEKARIFDTMIKDAVFLVLNNADLTEGRGPMVPKAISYTLNGAIEIAKNLPTIMGVGPKGNSAEILMFKPDSILAPIQVWVGYKDAK